MKALLDGLCSDRLAVGGRHLGQLLVGGIRVFEVPENECGSQPLRCQLAFTLDDLGDCGGPIGERAEKGLHAADDLAYS